jgi:hypothetical protein
MRIAGFVVVVSFVFLQALSAWAAGPTISFEYEVKDLGQVSHEERVPAQFPLTNVGDTVLVIQKVEADCGCTETFNESREVPPKGRSEITAVLDTATLSPGKNERYVYVKSNDLQRPIVTLTLVVEVVGQD